MTEPIVLQTERLLLRPWSAGDVEDVLAYSQDEEMVRYLPSVPRPFTRADAEIFIAQRILRSWVTSPSFAIVLDSAAIGGIGLDIDAGNAVGDLAYGISRAHWGKGLATEASRAVIDLGFTKYGLESIYAVSDIRNRGSWRVMEKLDMTRGGVLRSAFLARDGTRADNVHYAILRSEWEAARS